MTVDGMDVEKIGTAGDAGGGAGTCSVAGSGAADLAEGLGVFLRRFPTAQAGDLGGTGPLAGMRLGIKALIACAEAVPTAQSRVYDPDFCAGRDALVVARLRAAGARIAGVTTMAEHAVGRPDPALDFPIPRNPWDPARWPGGSSCGTASAIALGEVDAGLGTDTSGSCRIPAAFCGITGLRPSFGLLPLDGILPGAPSLDVVGPMARTAAECRRLLDVMRGRAGGAEDPALVDEAQVDLRGTVIGVPAELLAGGGSHDSDDSGEPVRVPDGARGWDERIAPGVGAAFAGALADLRAAGAEVRVVELPPVDDMVRVTMTIFVRELFDVHREGLVARWNDFGRSMRRTAASGALVDDAVYRAALERAGEYANRIDEVLAALGGPAGASARESRSVAIALPTWPQVAPPLVFKGGVPQNDWNLTGAYSATGHPALALPMGFAAPGQGAAADPRAAATEGMGLPVSLQLIGRHGGDDALLDLGQAYQALTDHHLRMPDRRAAAAGLARVEPMPDPDAEPASEEELAAVPQILVDRLAELGIPAGLHDLVTIAGILS